MRDTVNLHVVAGTLGVRERHLQWVAIRLADGSSDGNVYESRRDAARYISNATDGWFIVKIGVDSMGEREAIIVLQQARQAWKAGVRFADHDLVTPQLSELLQPYIPTTLGILGKGPR